MLTFTEHLSKAIKLSSTMVEIMGIEKIKNLARREKLNRLMDLDAETFEKVWREFYDDHPEIEESKF